MMILRTPSADITRVCVTHESCDGSEGGSGWSTANCFDHALPQPPTSGGVVLPASTYLHAGSACTLALAEGVKGTRGPSLPETASTHQGELGMMANFKVKVSSSCMSVVIGAGVRRGPWTLCLMSDTVFTNGVERMSSFHRVLLT